MKLYIIATPIGNLEDFAKRAVKTLESVDFILCEDTRRTKLLLDYYKIATPVISYHQHSRLGKMDYILDLLSQNKELALVSDAGTPGIADPGNQLIDLAVKRFKDLAVIPVPGPCAAIAALSISGFPTDKFIFYGFIPHKKGKEKILEEMIESKITAVFYESSYRIVKTLKRLKELELNKRMVVCRELTKKFETVYRGKIEEVLEKMEQGNLKGEFVVVVAPK